MATIIELNFDFFADDVLLKSEGHANKDYGFDLPDGTSLHGRALTMKASEAFTTSGVVIPQPSNGQSTTTLGSSVAIDDQISFITVPDTR